VYQFIGVLDEFKKQGGPVQQIQIYDAEGNPQERQHLVKPCDPSPDIPEVGYTAFVCLHALTDSHSPTFGY